MDKVITKRVNKILRYCMLFGGIIVLAGWLIIAIMQGVSGIPFDERIDVSIAVAGLVVVMYVDVLEINEKLEK